MSFTVAILGRPNVGKSTLFNRLTGTRDAIVADVPGVTRDRQYGFGTQGPVPYIVIDTGGLIEHASGLDAQMQKQAERAIEEADRLIFVADARTGLTAQDQFVARAMRRSGKPVFLAVNKAEGMDKGMVVADFHELGLGQPYSISATHGEGVRHLIDFALDGYPEPEEEDAQHLTLKVAIAGRPNVGKSTLVNTLLGEERVIAFDAPGTTRDAIEIDFERNGQRYTLVDTAGMRRRGKVFEAIEKFSVIKTLQSIEDAHVVILMLDARQDVSDQDAHIADFILESGRALVVAVNKWDKLDAYVKEQTKAMVARKLKFLDFANVHYISALDNIGIEAMFKSVNAAYKAAMAKLSTPQLTRVLIDAVAKQTPPRHGLFRPKPRYAHQGGSNPPIIVIHGNALDHIGDSYKRYLEHTFREAFKLKGTPLRIQFNTSKNPFAEREK